MFFPSKHIDFSVNEHYITIMEIKGEKSNRFLMNDIFF